MSMLLCVVLIMLSATWVQAMTYYVAKTGNDAFSCVQARSVGTPKLTVLAGVACLGASDTLIIKAGTYHEGNIVVPSGATGAHTTLIAASGETVTLRPAARVPPLAGIDTIWLIPPGTHHVTFDGIILDGRDASGANATAYPVATQDYTAHHLTFKNGVIQYALHSGMLVSGSVWEIRNNHIHHNGVNCCGTGHDDHGLYFSANTSLIIKNTFNNNACYNIQNYGGIDRDNNTFDSNIFTASRCGVTLTNGTGHTFKNNVMYDDNTDGAGGLIFKTRPTYVYNNTIINTDVLVLGGGDAASTEIRNTIICGGSLVTAGSTRSHNLLSCPAFVNAPARNYRLPTGSAAINAGTPLAAVPVDFDGVTRPQGGTFDIGAFEFSSSPPLTVDPPLGLVGTYGCAVSPNTLNTEVLGSLVYLPAGVLSTSLALAQANCGSNQTWTDVASILQSGFATTKPFEFLGAAGPNTANVCSNCLAVHNGTASTTAVGAGWTLPGFREGGTLAAATSGTHAMTLLPGLCRQYVEGTLTDTPLWPWPMDARLQAARALAGRPASSLTNTMSSLLGAIPAACLSTPPIDPGPATWIVATTGVDGGACSLEAPCATLAHVFGRMQGGDAVYLRGGTYAQRILTATTPIPGGTSWSAPTLIASYGLEVAILQVATDVVVYFNNPATDRYIVLDRLILDGSATTSTTTNGLAVAGGAGPVRFQNGVIRNSHFDRVFINGAAGVEILNSTITSGTTLPAVRVLGTTNGVILDGNTITQSPTGGVVFGSGTHTQARITRNIFSNNGTVGLQLGGGTLFAANNLVHHNGTVGVQVLGTCQACQVLYHTVADNTGVEVQIDPGATNTVLTNVLAVGGITDNGTDTVLTTNYTSDPGFVGGNDYHLAADTSPAADAGTCLPGVVDVALDTVARPQPPGGACDIGSYERSGDPGPPVPTPGALSGRPWQSRMFLLPQ